MVAPDCFSFWKRRTNANTQIWKDCEKVSNKIDEFAKKDPGLWSNALKLIEQLIVQFMVDLMPTKEKEENFHSS